MAFVSYVQSHRHEAIPQRNERIEHSDGLVRGRFAPQESSLAIARTGMWHRVACFCPEHSYETGPNRVLGWTLNTAIGLLCEARSRIPIAAPQHDLAVRALGAAESARRLLSAVDDQFLTRVSRPSDRDLVTARRARKPIYRLAAGAFDLLDGCETLDTRSLTAVMTDAVIAPTYPWQRFELLMLLAMAEALAGRLRMPIQLRLLVPGDRSPVATVGTYALYWQSGSPLYASPDEEPSELRTRELLEAFGLRGTADRPDVVVVDLSRNTVLGIAEAKYSESEGDSTPAFRDAASQIVRYSRGYERSTPYPQLIARSLIAISRIPDQIRYSQGLPTVVDLELLLGTGGLAHWANSITLP